MITQYDVYYTIIKNTIVDFKYPKRKVKSYTYIFKSMKILRENLKRIDSVCKYSNISFKRFQLICLYYCYFNNESNIFKISKIHNSINKINKKIEEEWGQNAKESTMNILRGFDKKKIFGLNSNGETLALTLLHDKMLNPLTICKTDLFEQHKGIYKPNNKQLKFNKFLKMLTVKINVIQK